MGLRLVADTLAEQRRVRRETAVIQAAQYRDALVEGLTGHESARAKPHAVFPDESAHARTVGGGEDCAAHCVVCSRGDTHSIGDSKR